MRFALFVALFSCAAMSSCAGERPFPRAREPVEQVVTHRVEQGESWRTLARDFYGNEDRAAALARDNGMDAAVEPRAGSAVRIFLSEREVKHVRNRLDAAREYNAGLDLAAEGNYAAAIGRFEESIKLDPGLADASYNLAIAYQRLAFHKKAVSILRDLVSVAPGNVAYRYALGASLLGAGDLEGAEKAFLAALAADPSHRKSLFSLAVVFEKRGAVEQAKEKFRRYLSLDPHGDWADSARAHLRDLERSGGEKR
ncbi:MAG: tetratricopeptide repeat protein [Candidatus Krumholzibacteriia bacterium]